LFFLTEREIYMPVFSGNNREKIRIAGIVKESVVDGPGLRAVVFFQGCPHRCPGCHNPETWDPNGGYEATPAEIWADLGYEQNPLLSGITLTGGEPLLQPAAALALALMTRARSGNVMLYTGYTWEEVMTFPSETVRELLHHLELMVDGPFLEAEKEEGLVFRGSRNQRIIKVQPSLANGEIVLWHNAGKEEE
jgi:anaerobic ribonucleoside-triphosphate reductase activating protein